MGQIAVQAPQPLQRASLTDEIPLISRKSIAEYGQISIHNLQPAQSAESITAVVGSTSICPLAARVIASAAAAEA